MIYFFLRTLLFFDDDETLRIQRRGKASPRTTIVAISSHLSRPSSRPSPISRAGTSGDLDWNGTSPKSTTAASLPALFLSLLHGPVGYKAKGYETQ